MRWQTEWGFWINNADLSPLHVPDFIKELLVGFVQRNLPPLAGRLDLINQEGGSVPGHTPGHMALSITSHGAQLLHLVDPVLYPIHLAHPDWVAAVDLLPGQTVATHQRLLKQAADEQALALLFPFPAPELGCINAQEDSWSWQAVDS